MQTRRLQYIHMFHVELGDRGFALRVAASCRALSFSAPTTWRRGGVGGVSVRARTRRGLCAKSGELREGADNNQVGFNSVIERY